MQFFIIAFVLILLDQVTKISVKGFNLFGMKHEGMMLGESFPVLGEWFRITFVENPGMAFGISFGPAKIFLSLFSILASCALGWYLYKLRPFSKWVQLGVALMMAGAVGNLIDRVFYGVFYGESPLFYGLVVDLFDVEFPDFAIFGHHFSRWPVFNIADSCVSCGVVLLLLVHKHIPTFDQLKKGIRPELHEPPFDAHSVATEQI